MHKGLRRLIEDDHAAGLPAVSVPKLRTIVSFLQDMGSEDELRTIPSWRSHQLTGDRKGTWALHVTRNWRVTFIIDQHQSDIVDLNYEDYH